MKKQIKVVGLDPSLRNWGIVICSVELDTGYMNVDSMITSRTSQQPNGGNVRATTWDIHSASSLYADVYNAVVDADIVCVEVPTGAQNAKGATGHGICLGILGSLVSDKFVFVTPQSVKKIIGSKDATKAESVALAVKRHPEAKWPKHHHKISVTKAEHCADAIHAIYAAAQTKEFKKLYLEYNHASTNQKANQN